MKTFNIKTLIVACVVVLTLGLLAGCAGQAQTAATSAAVSAAETSADAAASADEAASADAAASSAEASSASAGALDAAFPNHAASMAAGEGIASLHTACTDCHTDALTDEVAATGVEGEPELSSLYYVDTDKCQTCHGTYETLAKATDSLGDYNPHASIHGTIETCNECHKGHSSQVDICGECHPNGGQTMKK